MTAAPGNQKGAAGETTFAFRLCGHRARQNKRTTLFDADRRGLALLSLEQRAGKRQERLFAVISLTQAALRRKTPEQGSVADDIIIDGSSRIGSLPRSAPVAADAAQVPTPLDSRASTGVSGRVFETRVFRATHIAHASLGWPTGRDDPRFPFSLSQRVTFAEGRAPGSSGRAKQRRDGFAAHETRHGPRDRKACALRSGSATADSPASARRPTPEPPDSQPRPGASQPGSPRTTGPRSAAASRP